MVRSVVNVPKEAKRLTEHQKYKAKMDEIIKIYGEVLIGKACQRPPVRGESGEATMPRGYRPPLHCDFQMKGEHGQTVVNILQGFIERGWIEPCASGPPPAVSLERNQRGSGSWLWSTVI